MMRGRTRSLEAISLGLSDARRLTALFCAHAGLTFPDSAMAALERRLRERVVALGLRSFTEYVNYLYHHIDRFRELDEALDLVTVHETYFFREQYQLKTFETDVLPRLHQNAATRKRLLIWSAGCSTGEETYTIAMILAQSALSWTGWDLRVLGSDLSRRCLTIARRGTYGRSAFRCVPPVYRSAYFVEKGGVTHVDSAIRKRCTFLHVNLLNPTRTPLLGQVDAIFCRNVLIYFDRDARQHALTTLYHHLIPGGYLMLGHAESLLQVSSGFEAVRLADDLVYRKPQDNVKGRNFGLSRLLRSRNKYSSWSCTSKKNPFGC